MGIFARQTQKQIKHPPSLSNTSQVTPVSRSFGCSVLHGQVLHEQEMKHRSSCTFTEPGWYSVHLAAQHGLLQCIPFAAHT